MHMDPMMVYLVGAVALILLVGLVLRRLRQPHVVAYLFAGILIGPSGLAIIEDAHAVARFGEIGVVLLLFFAGMEMSIDRLLASWRVAVLGTALQIVCCVAAAWLVGYVFEWPLSRSVLLGFVMSLSSTSVVMKLMQSEDGSQSDIADDVIGVLLVQDIAIVPMLFVLGLLAGQEVDPQTSWMQLVGGSALIVFVGMLARAARRGNVHLPFGKLLRRDHELQLFSALLLAFGLALVTGLMGLSTALGAFVAGLVVGAAKETEWVSSNLHSHYVLLLALFFVSVGMMVDLDFVASNWRVVALVCATVFVLKTVLCWAALRVLGLNTAKALRSAASLAQIGEFSFVLAAVGMEGGVISNYAYQLTLATIAASLAASPAWIWLLSSMVARTASRKAT